MSTTKVNFAVSDVLSYGTEENPVELTRAEYQEVMAWADIVDRELRSRDMKEWDAYIAEAREHARVQFPWWFPGVSVRVVE